MSINVHELGAKYQTWLLRRVSVTELVNFLHRYGIALTQLQLVLWTDSGTSNTPKVQLTLTPT